MKYSEITEDVGVSSQSDVMNSIRSMIISLSLGGATEIPFSSFTNELTKRLGINVPASDLIELIKGLPMVSDVSTDSITFDNPNESNSPSSADQVADMAKAPADNTF
jgi:hypothetical protein